MSFKVGDVIVTNKSNKLSYTRLEVLGIINCSHKEYYCIKTIRNNSGYRGSGCNYCWKVAKSNRSGYMRKVSKLESALYGN